MATSVDMFAYLAAFVSVVLALALSDLVQSLHRLLRDRRRVRWSLVALLAAVLVFMAILEEFFGLWRLSGLERFTYFDLLSLIVPAILLSMAAMSVLPDEVPERGLDLAAHYMENRKLLFLLLTLWVLGVFLRLLDLFEVVTGKAGSTLELASMFPWQTIPLLAVFALLSWTTNLRVHLIGMLIVIILVNSTMIHRAIDVRPDRRVVVS